MNGESGEATSRKAAWPNARNAPWGRSGWARRSTKYQGVVLVTSGRCTVLASSGPLPIIRQPALAGPRRLQGQGILRNANSKVM